MGDLKEAPWLALLRDEAAARSITAVARDLGVSRTAISLVLSGKYAGSTRNIEARMLEVFSRVVCPYTGSEISPQECRERAGDIPTSSPRALRWWKMCQTCEHNPRRTDG